MKLASLYKTGD